MSGKKPWNEVRADLRKSLIGQCKFTVGYREAEDKRSFETGMTMAIDKALDIVEKKQRIIDSLQDVADHHKGNLKTIADILDQYREED